MTIEAGMGFGSGTADKYYDRLDVRSFGESTPLYRGMVGRLVGTGATAEPHSPFLDTMAWTLQMLSLIHILQSYSMCGIISVNLVACTPSVLLLAQFAHSHTVVTGSTPKEAA